MKKDMLKVGTQKGEFFVEVEIEMPSNLSDCQTLSKGNADYLVAKFSRGYRIDLQEGGARQVVVEMLAGKNAIVAMKDAEFMAKVKAAVAAEIASFDPAAPRARGGRKPAAPTVVTLDPNKTSYTAAELMALLANVKGVVVES